MVIQKKRKEFYGEKVIAVNKLLEMSEIREQVKQLKEFMSEQDILIMINDYHALLRLGGAECQE